MSLKKSEPTQLIKLTYLRAIKPLQIAPENAGNRISETLQIKTFRGEQISLTNSLFFFVFFFSFQSITVHLVRPYPNCLSLSFPTSIEPFKLCLSLCSQTFFSWGQYILFVDFNLSNLKP